MLLKTKDEVCPFGRYLHKKLSEWGHSNRRRNVAMIVDDINKRARFDVLTGNQTFHTWIKKGPCLQGSGYLRDREEEVFEQLFGEDWKKALCLCPRRNIRIISGETIAVLRSMQGESYVYTEDIPFVQMDLEIRKYWGDQFGFHTNIFDLVKPEDLPKLTPGE